MRKPVITAEQLKLVEDSVVKAHLRRICYSMGIPNLDARFLPRVLRVIPPEFHALFKDAWEIFPADLLLTSNPPCKDLFTSVTTESAGRLREVCLEKKKELAELSYDYITQRTLLHLRDWKAQRKRNAHFSLYKKFHVVKKAILAAYKREDFSYLARVGDVLRKRQKSTSNNSRLQEFLIVHWTNNYDGVAPLFDCSRKELLDACNKHFKHVANLTEGAVDKTRERLGLISFRQGSLQVPKFPSSSFIKWVEYQVVGEWLLDEDEPRACNLTEPRRSLS